MVIRSGQMQVLEQSASANYVDFTLEHLKEYFPRQCDTLGDEQMRRVIRHSWQAANQWDVFSERGVWQFVDLSLMLGSSLDTDPKLPWVREMLEGRSILEEIPRMDALFRRGMEYVEELRKDFPAGGAEAGRLRAGIKRIRQETDEPVPSGSFAAFSQEMARELRSYFPATCGYIGEQTLITSLEFSCMASERYGITSKRGVAIYSTLALFLGSGFDTDLQYPWAACILTDKSIVTAAERADRLYNNALEELKQWIEMG